MSQTRKPLLRPNQISHLVSLALAEDIGTGDITAELIPPEHTSKASIFCREPAVLCGVPWAEEVSRQIQTSHQSPLKISWLYQEGESIPANSRLCELEGNTRTILTIERTLLNFIQTLSGTATRVNHTVKLLENTQTQLLDTRKTIPGLRFAQKYAVRVGGGSNHRLGLFDAFLIKENHIRACGSIEKAILKARILKPQLSLEIEIANLHDLTVALEAKADIIMLDNFDISSLQKAVALTRSNYPDCKLEASGGITLDKLAQIARTGVDYISVGSITKQIKAIDLSLQLH